MGRKEAMAIDYSMLVRGYFPSGATWTPFISWPLHCKAHFSRYCFCGDKINGHFAVLALENACKSPIIKRILNYDITDVLIFSTGGIRKKLIFFFVNS